MLQKIKTKLIAIAALAMLALPLAAPAVVLAQGPSIEGGVCSGAENLQLTGTPPADCQVTGGDEAGFNALLTKIINVISVIVGVVAVIMIIYGGFRYITSGGTPEKVTGAKNTILYGIIGLIIVALAQVVVRFVLKQVTDAA